MTSTNTNKQPVFIDRPLYDTVRVTTQIAGRAAPDNTMFVQGGQQPALLVDMDALLSQDNNSGGIIDSLTIVRNDEYREPDYTVTSSNGTSYWNLVSGQIVNVEASGTVSGNASSGNGYYTYTGSVTLNQAIDQTTIDPATASTSGFSYLGALYPIIPEAQFIFYQSRGTTTPIPASGDYHIVFAKTVPANVQEVDCSEQMPVLDVPVPQAGNTTGLGNGVPLRNRGIYMQRSDRLYVGVFPGGPQISGYGPGATVIAQGGYY